MKVIIVTSIAMVAVIAIFWMGKTSTIENDPNGKVRGTIKRMKLEAHSYIVWGGSGYKGGITHDPDCECIPN